MIKGVHQPLTREGNVYKPSRTGAVTGGILGTLGAYKIIAGDTFIKAANKKFFNEAANAKGFMNSVKSISKSAGSVLLTGIAGGITIALGVLAGNTLFDAPKNQERRDQADGEAALRAKIIAAHQDKELD